MFKRITSYIIAKANNKVINNIENQFCFGDFKINFSKDLKIYKKSNNEIYLLPSFLFHKKKEFDQFFIIKIYYKFQFWWLESDPCGLHSPYYRKDKFILTNDYDFISNNNLNFNINKINPDKEFFYGFGETPFDNIFKLMPTYKFNLDKYHIEKNKVWIPKKINQFNQKKTINKFIQLIRNYLYSAHLKYKLKVGITGGYDSSIVLSILLKYKIPFEPFIFVGDSNSKVDSLNVKKIEKKYGLEVNYLKRSKNYSNKKSSQKMIGGNILKYINYLDEFEASDAYVMNICAECGINQYNLKQEKIDLLNTYKSLIEKPTSMENHNIWIKDLKKNGVQNLFDIGNNFFIDCRMGGWGAGHFSIGDFNCQIIDPFNQHDLVRIMTDYGSYNNDRRYLHKMILRELNPGLLDLVLKNKNLSKSQMRVKRIWSNLKYYFL